MSYAELVDRLGDEFTTDPQRIVSLPDGSVDHCYRVTGPGGAPLESRADLGRQLLEDGETFPLERLEVRPGGQAVNASVQIRALGDDPTLVGHLDHRALADLPFETRSMGSPATIRVLAFDGEECLFPERAGRSADWGVDDLLAVVDWEDLADADALCCGNWISFRGLTEVFERLATRAVDCPLVLDPGAIGLAERAAVAALFDALAAADESLDVALSVSRSEYEAAADVVDVSGDDPAAVLSAVRSALGITAVVFHGADEAIAATGAGTTRVETPDVGDPQLTMGAGDRFTGGLACALARDWPWDDAIALGNACASYFVATGETGDRSALTSFVRERR
ncbi:carbohydrate kinase family protein [Natronococcus wangiae]|uniref:carbohydrate kinase family protein n=1 Tax=Natronococcus wangiae TaxID=3068275 RepID=UPI00273D4BA5|nr:carbohydrate kinase family protein [Natronococcus sp. AD5]